MLAARAVAAGVTRITAAVTMSSAAGAVAHSQSGGPQGSGSPRRKLQRLPAVPGCPQNRVNDLLLLRPEPDGGGCSGQDSSKHVVFFHGDIQNFQEEMALQAEAAPWLCWSLEQVTFLLGRRFPHSFVWVVRASCMYLLKFSCYQNFVESNLFGVPEHRPYSTRGAFRHLRALLSSALERANMDLPLQPLGGADSIPPGFSLTLVGFSKGCVVLNQLVYELAGARSDPLMSSFVDGITDMFWLDGGHPGGGETWVTDRPALQALAASGVSIHVHVTPYEVQDPMRAWVGREHRRFIQTLEELGACPSKKLHFQDEPPSIENHFRVLLEF